MRFNSSDIVSNSSLFFDVLVNLFDSVNKIKPTSLLNCFNILIDLFSLSLFFMKLKAISSITEAE